MDSKKIIIVCFTFPPCNGIGGRRWAKFAKYLDKLGHDVQVITSECLSDGAVSPWVNDVKSLRNAPLIVKSNYPKILVATPDNLFGKVNYKIQIEYLKRFTKGNYFDKSILWGKPIVKEVEKLISKGYNNVIVTGAPFRTTHHLALLKKKYPAINYLVDLRDPWVGNKTNYGFFLINKNKQKEEELIEAEVVNTANATISVYEEMTERFNAIYKKSNNNLTIPNGFDREDFIGINSSNENKGKFRLILAGTLYDKVEHVFSEFIEVLKKLKVDKPAYYNMLQIDFYGVVSGYFSKYVSNIDIIKFHGALSLQDVFHEISASQACMLFLTDDMTFSLSTKFYEYAAMKKSIVLFSKKGRAGEFVEENNLGYLIPYGNMYNRFIDVCKDFQNDTLKVNRDYNLKEFDVQELVKKIENLLV